MRHLALAFLTCFFNFCAFSQNSALSYRFVGTGAMTTRQTPFWLHANSFGLVPVNGPYITLQGGVYRNYAASNKKIDWKAGVELVALANPKPDLFLSDAYLMVRLGKVEVLVGQKKGIHGFMDSTLSSGPVAWSGNARPFPKVEVTIPDFQALAFTRNFIAIKGNFADGMLGKARVQYGNVHEVPDIYLHQKSLYVRMGKPQQKLHLFGGFNHQVMWGGEYRIFTGGLKPSQAYKYSVIGKSWASSRVGNHFGTIDFGGDWRGKKWTISGYRQNIYEDGSLAQLTNLSDGLNGLLLTRNDDDSAAFRNPIINKILLEFLTTKSQGGSIFDFQNGIFGRDNYFNHYVYTQGWSYRGRALGTPLLSNQSLFRENIPRSDSAFTTNNRLWAIHLGLVGQMNGIKIITKGTYSQNFGTYNRSLLPSKGQFSFFLKGEKKLSRHRNDYISVQLAADAGGLYPFTMGVGVSWRKDGILIGRKSTE